MRALQITFGLHEVAGSASLTLVFFPALVLLGVLGIRFGYYAFRNRTVADLGTQAPIWTHLLYVGFLAAVYGALGVLEIVSSVAAPYKSTVMLALVLLLALTMRRIYGLSSGSPGTRTVERVVQGLLLALLLVTLVAVLVGLSARFRATVEGAAALAFLAYGLAYYREQTAQSRLQGTMVDSLLRHLLPILTFAALVNATTLAFGLGLVGSSVVPHVQVVFVVMTASTLMTATIKLRQNVATL